MCFVVHLLSITRIYMPLIKRICIDRYHSFTTYTHLCTAYTPFRSLKPILLIGTQTLLSLSFALSLSVSFFSNDNPLLELSYYLHQCIFVHIHIYIQNYRLYILSLIIYYHFLIKKKHYFMRAQTL